MAAGDRHVLQDIQVISGQAAANIWYIETIDDTAVIGDKLQNLLEMWESEVIPEIVKGQSDELVHQQLTVRRVEPTTSPLRVFGVNSPGLLVGPTLPANNALILREYGEVNNARQQGRVYLPGTPENVVSDGRATSAHLSAFDDLITVVTQNITFLNGVYRVVHRFGGPTAAWVVVTAIQAWPVIAKIRNRTPKLSLTS